MDTIADNIKQKFANNFTGTPRIFFSPGRINLIGEHVDYNDGFVMPAAINKGVFYALAPNGTGRINFIAIDFNETASLDLKVYSETMIQFRCPDLFQRAKFFVPPQLSCWDQRVVKHH